MECSGIGDEVFIGDLLLLLLLHLLLPEPIIEACDSPVSHVETGRGKLERYRPKAERWPYN